MTSFVIRTTHWLLATVRASGLFLRRPQKQHLEDITCRLDAGNFTGMRLSLSEGRPDRAARGIRRRWQNGIEDELRHWTRYLLDTVKSDAEERWRLDRALPFDKAMMRWIDPNSQDDLQVLDVGAGPLTTLGKTWAGRRLTIVAVDALADLYDQALGEAEIEPPVRTIKCDAETLAETFSPDYFDLVYCANTLDHCYDPLRAIDNMLRVLKPGCDILLRHFPNEAEKSQYAGFHQWNIWSHRGYLIIWNRRATYLVNKMFEDRCTIDMVDDGGLLTCYLRRFGG